MRHLVFVLVVALSPLAAIAQPAPQLTGFVPIYLKQGQTQEVTLTGKHLAGATKVFLTDANGLSAELIGSSATDAATKPVSLRLRLAAGPEAELGVREMRVATPNGVTRAVTVTVGQYNPTTDAEPNNSAREAQVLSFPTSLVGQLDAGGDLDDFRFDARKGQTLVFDVFASRLGSAVSPVVAILDGEGREMPRKVSFQQPAVTADADPTIIFEVPADGAYTLHVRDLQFRGGGDYAYRIDAGAIPFVESIVPASGRRGASVQVRAIGYNLGKNPTQTLDLAPQSKPANGSGIASGDVRGAEEDAGAPAAMQLRFKSAAGVSNAVPFAITDAAPIAEKSSNNAPDKAMQIEVPAEVSGVLAQSGEEDFYRFKATQKQPVTFEVVARQSGSPVDALLTLRDGQGKPIEQNNGAGEAEARISRSFDPGEYIISIRDLTFGGGSGYGYRLHCLNAGSIPPDFAVRFIPDASRINRGGHARLWCEIVRLNGYKSDVAVSLEGLPPGVTVTGGPAVLGEKTSGIFTLSAAADAALGNFPIRLKAVGVGGAQQVRYGDAEEDGRTVRGTYLSVLPAAPIGVDSLAQISTQQIAGYPDEVQKLYAKIHAPSPELDKAQAEWEKKLEGSQQWQVMEVTSAESSEGATLTKQPDGSVLQSGKSPEKDTFTVIGTANLKQVTGVRLEVLPDPSLPNNGPGRSGAGNFMLSTFAVSIAAKSDPKNTRPVTFSSAKATFEQSGYAAIGAANNQLTQGWAIFGGTGKAQTAWFFPEEPVPAGDVIVTVSMIQFYGEQHTIGRFRIALTDDPEAKDRQTESAPPAVAAALKTPADKRTEQQKSQLAAYYRSIAPQLQADRARLEALRSSVGPIAEVARLEQSLAAGSAALDAERKEWEQTVAAGFAWTPVNLSSAKSANGTLLNAEKDGSFIASGPVPPADVYQLSGKTSLRAITAIRIEALPDERFVASGPGQNKGNFVLTRFDAGVPGTKPGETVAVPLRDPRASFEQSGYGVSGTLDANPETGWAIAPLTGMAHTATFFPKTPIVATGDGITLNVTMEFNHPKHKGFTLGRFRLWALGAADASAATSAATSAVPGPILDILKIEEAKRTQPQKDEVNAYFRTIAPSLEPTRQRLAELRARLPEFPITVVRNKSGSIPVPISRSGDFSGPVKITLEGFSSGRDPATRMPMNIVRNFDVTPLNLAPDQSFGRLAIKAKNNAEIGTRMVVLRAEAKVGEETIVQYSPAFPLTVTEK